MASDGMGQAPRLRWAIDTAATPGRWGDLWGDTHFAESLARALRRLGQQVTIDRRDTRERAGRAEDDVVLALRGLEIGPPQPGAINLLWVISHPDDVTADEAGRYAEVVLANLAAGGFSGPVLSVSARKRSLFWNSIANSPSASFVVTRPAASST